MNILTTLLIIFTSSAWLLICTPTEEPEEPSSTYFSADLGEFQCSLTTYGKNEDNSLYLRYRTSYYYREDGQISSTYAESWDYDDSFERGLHIQRIYDDENRIIQISRPQAEDTNYWYDDDGFQHISGEIGTSILFDEYHRRVEERHVNGLIRIFRYDELGRFIYTGLIGRKSSVNVTYQLDEEAHEWIAETLAVDNGEVQYHLRNYYPEDVSTTISGSYIHKLRSESFEDGQWVPHGNTTILYEGNTQINDGSYRLVATYLDDCGEPPVHFGYLNEDRTPRYPELIENGGFGP